MSDARQRPRPARRTGPARSPSCNDDTDTNTQGRNIRNSTAERLSANNTQRTGGPICFILNDAAGSDIFSDKTNHRGFLKQQQLTESQRRMCQRDYWSLRPTPGPVRPATPSYRECVCSPPARRRNRNVSTAINLHLLPFWIIFIQMYFKCHHLKGHIFFLYE